MSHLAKIDLEVNDLAALEASCAPLGLEFVRGQQTYRWFGRSVGDYPLPEGFKASDLGKCDHAIRVKGNYKSYEVGVVARKDGKPGYTLLWDFWCDGFGLQDKVGDGGGKLIQEYVLQVATKDRVKQGYRVNRVTAPNGHVQLHCVRASR